jgi:hypothetical protein
MFITRDFISDWMVGENRRSMRSYFSPHPPPNLGRSIAPSLALPTEFEMRVRHLQLTTETYTCSGDLRACCEQNRNRLYVPEWLFEEWDITVDLNFGAVARPNHANNS